MEKQTVLITGGTGFAGSHLVESLLLENTPKSIHVTSFGGKPGFVASLLPATNIHKLDLTNYEETKTLLSKIQPTHIFHLAASASVVSSFEQARATMQNNLDLQLSLLDAVKDVCPDARILNIGSALEYDFTKSRVFAESAELGPVSPYAFSKVMQDMLAVMYQRSHKLHIIRTRPFNHFGERQTPGFVVADFAKKIVEIEKDPTREKLITVGNLEAVRDFCDVKDMVEAYKLLMDKGAEGEVYNIGSGVGTSIKQILDELISLTSLNIQVEIDPEKFRPLDVPTVIADNEKIKNLGWSPSRHLSETLLRTLNWWRNNS
ncbi:MAG: GDP-mannose 4,6-dehydratase [Patescibacteria group bacterium]